jgi:hypothetical protein
VVDDSAGSTDEIVCKMVRAIEESRIKIFHIR